MCTRIAMSAAVAAALAVIAAPVAPAAAGARPFPGPDGVTIEIEATYNGGCMPESTFAAVDDDAEAFVISYDRYWAAAGGPAKPWEARKGCLLVLKLHVPRGFTYAVTAAEHVGHASLADGAKATMRARHYFQGEARPEMIRHELNGPHKDDWRFIDRSPSDRLAWKPCGEEPSLNLGTDVEVDKGTSNPSKQSFISMFPMADGPEVTYHLAWKPCP